MKSYEQQYNKLTEAYIRNEVQPFTACGCFCGNLVKGEADADKWRINAHAGQGTGGYSPLELRAMEKVFMKAIRLGTVGKGEGMIQYVKTHKNLVLNHPNYENALFNAFAEALTMLKLIHQHNHSEAAVKPSHTFKKRQLQLA
jgi:hypothetical protein